MELENPDLVKIGKRIRIARMKARLTQKELASKLHVSESMVSRYEKGALKKVNLDLIKDVAKITGFTPEEILDWEPERRSPRLYEGIVEPTYKQIPLIGSIACGEPVYADREYEYVTVEDSIPADFCLRANGESMTGARIMDGDLVFCKSCDMVNNGDIAAVIIDDEATLKRFFYYEDTNVVILRAENSNFKDLVYTGEDLNKVRVIGKAVSFQSLIR